MLLALYLLSLFFIGLGYLAIQPPFEGFDENAHYSSIREIAGTGSIPIYGLSFLDREVTDYKGPMPYGSLTPPFDEGTTYSSFFSQAHSVKRYLSEYRESAGSSSYQVGRDMNWQAQHPPLYYLLLAPLEKATEPFSFAARIFLLRLASFVLALAGVTLGWFAGRNPNKPLKDDPSVVGFMIYPLILPMFFTEFTRIGNDSLCLFLVGAAAFLLSKILADETNKKYFLAIGVVLGLGLLSKAFFIPITLSVSLFLLMRLFRDRHPTSARATSRENLIMILFPAILIGGGWYLYKFVTFGTLIGSNDSIQLAKQGGLTANLDRNFSAYGMIRGILVTVVTYVYGGSWSLVRLPLLLYLPLLGIVAGCFVAYAFQLKQRPFTDSAWLPALLFFTFGAGFLYHILISVALNGNGNTPGWYLHILMPWIAPSVGIGFLSISKTKTKHLLTGLLLYAALFHLIALWCQLALFTGCATKSDAKFYVFPGNLFCLDQIPILIDRLFVLGWPVLAVVGFGCGMFCALLLWTAWRKSGGTRYGKFI
ncbi:DUF2142 domain-containing protein [Methylomonas sp. MgM2]